MTLLEGTPVLYTDSFYLATMKFLIANEINGLDLKLAGGDLSADQTIRLEMDNGKPLTSPNAICGYLYSKGMGNGYDFDSSQWLAWEHTKLSPSVVSLLKSLKDEELATLMEHLQHLDQHLGTEGQVRGEESLPDTVLWSNIYLLKNHPKLSRECFQDFNHINAWFDSLSQLETFRNAAEMFEFSTEYSSTKELHLEMLDEDQMESLIEDIRQEEEITEEKAEESYQTWLEAAPFSSRCSSVHPILPAEGKKNVLITSALPYVNNVPHLGNIIGSVLSADVFARYCRLRGYNTLYVCGTDEYGTATETKALQENITPQEICNKYNAIHAAIYDWFNISFDHFGRTSTEHQTQISQDIFWDLYNGGCIDEDSVEQLFCTSCVKFLADRFVEGTCPFPNCGYKDARGDQCDKCAELINATELKNPKCKVCGSNPEIKSSKHLFLNLPKIEPKLKTWLDETTASGSWTHIAKKITYDWIKKGLKPRCITRDLQWGTPVPLEGFQDKVFYVWFDAPIGYMSITAQYTDQWEQWWKQPDKVQLYQFMAKDNVPFHSIVFPSCLLGTDKNYTLVSHLSGISYLNYEDAKFSKSRGIGVFGTDCKDTTIPSDIWRFYLLFVRPERHDASFCWQDLMFKNNSELLGNIGNFIHRTLTLVGKNFKGKIPEMSLTSGDKLMIARINSQIKEYHKKMEKLILRDALKKILGISKYGNLYITDNEPWIKVKGSPEDKIRAGTVMGLSANIVGLLFLLLEPYLPDSTDKLRNQLNLAAENTLGDKFICLLPPGHQLGKPSQPLFKKIEVSEVNEFKTKFQGQ